MSNRRSSVFNTLSGRFLLLTVVFVMLAEVLIFVPSIARFRADYLLTAAGNRRRSPRWRSWRPTR